MLWTCNYQKMKKKKKNRHVGVYTVYARYIEH